MNRLLPLVLLCAISAGAVAQETPAAPEAEDPIHDELRALRDRMFEQYEARNLDGLLEGVAENIVITWQNGERQLNREQFVEFYNKMMHGESRIVQDVKSEFEVDGLSVLYGDATAVAYGTCVDHFQLTSGRSFTLNSKWTATVVKTDGQWKVASFHISSNIFENPMLSMAQSWLMYAGLAGAAVGLVVGVVLALLVRRSRTPRAVS